jgi:hypothetical protein
MAKFVNQVVLVENENCQSQLEFDTNVLSAAVVYMAEYYKDVFDGLDAVLKAASLPNKACTRLKTGDAKSDSLSNPAVSSG